MSAGGPLKPLAASHATASAIDLRVIGNSPSTAGHKRDRCRTAMATPQRLIRDVENMRSGASLALPLPSGDRGREIDEILSGFESSGGDQQLDLIGLGAGLSSLPDPVA